MSTYRKSTRGIDTRRADTSVAFLVIREVLVHDIERLLVDLEVVVLLEVVNRVHASSLLDVNGVLVDGSGARGLLVHLADLQDVVQTIERNLNDLIVHHSQQIAERLDAPLGDEVADLRWLLQATRCRVRDSPARLLASLEVGVLKNIDKRRDDVGVNNGLNLWRRACSDVGNRPTCLLPDTLLRRGQEG